MNVHRGLCSRFCSEKALKQLLEDGAAAAMRSYSYKKGRRILIKDCNGETLGRGLVLDVRSMDEESLKASLAFSVFEGVEEWIEEARRLHRKTPRFIVLVKSSSCDTVSKIWKRMSRLYLYAEECGGYRGDDEWWTV